MGINFKEYLILFRITEAKKLLITTDLSVSQIAEAVGYGRIFIRNAQIFADRQTVQPLRLIPTPSLPESYTRTPIVDETPQDL